VLEVFNGQTAEGNDMPMIDLPLGVTERRWSPISSTLISGRQDAVLVDTFITVEQNRQLAEWVEKSGKNLISIYATHRHGDHFFGVSTIRQRSRARSVRCAVQ
jgi:glyoxylase-like metal-dependent hydrolase (beta-lactamase superfamily II)